MVDSDSEQVRQRVAPLAILAACSGSETLLCMRLAALEIWLGLEAAPGCAVWIACGRLFWREARGRTRIAQHPASDADEHWVSPSVIVACHACMFELCGQINEGRPRTNVGNGRSEHALHDPVGAMRAASI